MRTAMLVTMCAAAISFAGCKKESTIDQTIKKSEQQENHVKRQAKKYTQSITGDQKAIQEQHEKAGK